MAPNQVKPGAMKEVTHSILEQLQLIMISGICQFEFPYHAFHMVLTIDGIEFGILKDPIWYSEFVSQ